MFNCKRKQQRGFTKTHKKNNLIAPSYADDVAAVASLPDTWEPQHASPLLHEYLKTQEQNHHNVLQDMTHEAAIINEAIDANVRDIAETLLAQIKQNDIDMTHVVVEAAVLLNTNSLMTLTPEERNVYLRRISDLDTRRIVDIALFGRESQVLERRRADELRKLLRDKFHLLIKVGHRPPRDLLHEFDQRAYEINQQLLSNFMAYAELEAQLHMQADKVIVRVKSSLNNMCLRVSSVVRHRSSACLHPDENHDVLPSSANDNGLTPELGHVTSEVEEIDPCVAVLVQSYMTAVMETFSGFSEELTDLHAHLGCYCNTGTTLHTLDVKDLQATIERVVTKLSSAFLTCQPSSPELMDIIRLGSLKMQKSIVTLGERLCDIYTIFYDAARFWHSHILRTALAQKLTITCVEDLLTNNDMFQLGCEVTFDIALEQLRCASDVDKLQQQYESIVAILERTSEMYKTHHNVETEKLEEFMRFPVTLASCLTAEFNCFLEKYPKSVQNTGSQEPSVSSWSLDADSFVMAVSRAILQTELQETSLISWKNGFLETFENDMSIVMSTVPEELTNYARSWVEEKRRALNMRYSLKLMSHSVRLERVKSARDHRLAELKSHEVRLESHLRAIYDLVDQLPIKTVKCLDAPEVYPFSDWMDRIQASIVELHQQDPIDPETKRLKMCSYATRLVKHRSSFEESLDSTIDGAKKEIGNRIQEVRVSNVAFASQLKLFSEGGRYSAQEATRASSLLIRCAEAVETCHLRSLDALNHRRRQLLELADQKLMPLQRIVEFAKPGGMGGSDKRKLLPKTSKVRKKK